MVISATHHASHALSVDWLVDWSVAGVDLAFKTLLQLEPNLEQTVVLALVDEYFL